MAVHATWENCIAKTLVFPTNDGMGRARRHPQCYIVVSGALEGPVTPRWRESESLPDGNYVLSPRVPPEVSVEHE